MTAGRDTPVLEGWLVGEASAAGGWRLSPWIIMWDAALDTLPFAFLTSLLLSGPG